MLIGSDVMMLGGDDSLDPIFGEIQIEGAKSDADFLP